MDHLISANLRYQLRPTTSAVVGYQYGISDYSSNVKSTSVVDGTTYVFNPQSKDQNSHFLYAGVDHNFTSQLMGSVRVGAQITEWDKYSPGGTKSGGSRSSTSPYADASVRYAYAEGSNVSLGVKHQRTATDLFTLVGSTNPVLDTESTTAYITVKQKITAKLNISGTAMFQNSDFEAPGTALDGESEQYWNFGVTLSYQFTRWLAGEASYYYDNLSSSDQVAFREYDRNRVFLGVRFSY
jgi:long-subunit fatty acid transport protein